MPFVHTVEIAGELFELHAAGALYWPKQKLLAIADLHLEKASSFAGRGVFLPPYDTAATLGRLAEIISFYDPQMIVALGDSFHDEKACQRLGAADWQTLGSLQKGREWIWIAGNHDPAQPEGLSGASLPHLSFGAIHFRHLPLKGQGDGEIAGHLHPVARIAGRAGSLRRRCFISNGQRCVMPAFGAFTGGLNVRHEAFLPLFQDALVTEESLVHVLGRNKVYAISPRFCTPD